MYYQLRRFILLLLITASSDIVSEKIPNTEAKLTVSKSWKVMSFTFFNSHYSRISGIICWRWSERCGWQTYDMIENNSSKSLNSGLFFYIDWIYFPLYITKRTCSGSLWLITNLLWQNIWIDYNIYIVFLSSSSDFWCITYYFLQIMINRLTLYWCMVIFDGCILKKVRFYMILA